MLNYKTLVILFFAALAACLAGCKKHDALPDLDQGNDFNPSSTVEFVKLDSSRVYNGVPKVLKCYVGTNTALINSNGFAVGKIIVYRNGFANVSLTPPSRAFLISNVLPGQIYRFEFSVVDSEGRESKKSRVYQVVI